MNGGMMGGGSMTAGEIELQPQGMSGTTSAVITSGSTTSFQLTPPSDGAFKTTTGATSVTVFQQTDTTIEGSSPIASGTRVHTFGPLFYDSGQWKIVAARIGAS
jgi:hypothetical protein